MHLDAIVIPDFEDGMNYHNVMAKLIAANDHDLVIEAAASLPETLINARGPSTLITLQDEYNWEGRYVTVNHDHQPYFTDKQGHKVGATMPDMWQMGNGSWNDWQRFNMETGALDESSAQEFLEYAGDSNQILVPGNGNDQSLINTILNVTKPSNPVFAVNTAVGILLCSCLPKDYEQLPEEDSFGIATEYFALSLTQTGLRRGYMSDRVRPDESQGRFFADLNGLSSTLYGMLTRQLSENGWNVLSKEVNNTSYGLNLLMFAR